MLAAEGWNPWHYVDSKIHTAHHSWYLATIPLCSEVDTNNGLYY